MKSFRLFSRIIRITTAGIIIAVAVAAGAILILKVVG